MAGGEVTLKILEAAAGFLGTPAGQILLKTGTGLVSHQGDMNYAKAVLTAEALYKMIGVMPVINEVAEGRYQVTWEGEQLQEATAYFRNMAINAMKPKTGEPEKGFYVDLLPVLKPLALLYGGVPLAVTGAALAGFGYVMGSKGAKR